MATATSASQGSSLLSLLRTSRILILAACVVLLVSLLPASSAHGAFPAQGSLAWDPVDDPAVAGYKVHYGTASRTYDTIEDVGSATSYPITDLAAGVTYYFAVTAYDTSLTDSDYSAELAYKVLAPDPQGDSVMAGCSGNLPSDPTWQQGVSFAFEAREGDYRLSYTAYDIALADQVRVYVNGTSCGFVPTTPDDGYSAPLTLELPDDLVSHDSYNIVRFVPNFDPPDSRTWGVCDMGLDSRAIALAAGGWYGNLKGVADGDTDHAVRVQFLLDAPAQIPPEGIVLRFRAYDVDFADEVLITVNGHQLAYAAKTDDNGYSGLIELAIPAWALDPGSPNVVTFANTYNPANNYVWGVGDVTVAQECADCIPLPSAAAMGRISGGDQTHPDRVNYGFPGMAGEVVIVYQVWDVDFSGEVEIFVNGVHLDYAPITPNVTWSDTQSLVIPEGLVFDAGPNVLTFDNLWNPPSTYSWGVRNVSIFEDCPECIPLPDNGAYGRISGGDLSHTNEVSYLFLGAAGDVSIQYQVWDVDFAQEVEIQANGVRVAYAPVTPDVTWSETRTVVLPDALVLDTGMNILTFSNTYNPPKNYYWGVRNVSMAGGACPDCIPLPAAGAYGKISGGDQSHVNEVSYSFAGSPGALELAYRVWDVDFTQEVEILVNGVHLGYAPVTPDETWSGVLTISLPDEMILDSGPNVITFSNTYNPPKTYWWGVSSVSVE